MSDTYISIVPIDVDKDKALALAEKFKTKLIHKNVISEDLTPSSNAISKTVSKNEVFKNLENNKLEIVIARQVFDNGGNGVEKIICPNCSFNIIETNWMDAIEEWYSNSGKDTCICPNCSEKKSISEYYFEPNWGFGELGFTFWNWPNFTDDFIIEIEKILNHKVKIIYGIL
ncbi:hypothetical protein [Aquimarina megaterium]|uniref:hypothetical protein n=1 Tax=Aquimarina megaterium TaxID=1443666 RepID=UPI0009443E75|nr:hypothetical protein [Aquimarina megaterium]